MIRHHTPLDDFPNRAFLDNEEKAQAAPGIAALQRYLVDVYPSVDVDVSMIMCRSAFTLFAFLSKR